MHNALWQSVLGEIELSVSHGNFETWFKNTELIDYSDSSVTIGVANIFAKSQFEKKFNDQIKDVLKRNGVNAENICYEVKSVKKRVISRETTGANEIQNRASELISRPQPAPATTLNPRYTFETVQIGRASCRERV